MTALVNNLLAKHYGKEALHIADPIRELSRVALCLTPAGANAMLSVQKLHGWSRDHVFEVALREHLGLPASPRARYIRRLPKNPVCQLELSVPNEVFNIAKERYPTFGNKATGHLVSPWLVTTSQRIADEEAGL